MGRCTASFCPAGCIRTRSPTAFIRRSGIIRSRCGWGRWWWLDNYAIRHSALSTVDFMSHKSHIPSTKFQAPNSPPELPAWIWFRKLTRSVGRANKFKIQNPKSIEISRRKAGTRPIPRLLFHPIKTPISKLSHFQISKFLPTVQLPTVQLIYPAFSPDGDGLNDTFMAIATSDYIQKFHMLIFDRWGGQIFESDDIFVGWDGTMHGKLLPGGMYTYKITYSVYPSFGDYSEQVRLGTVMMVRWTSWKFKVQIPQIDLPIGLSFVPSSIRQSANPFLQLNRTFCCQGLCREEF